MSGEKKIGWDDVLFTGNMVLRDRLADQEGTCASCGAQMEFGSAVLGCIQLKLQEGNVLEFVAMHSECAEGAAVLGKGSLVARTAVALSGDPNAAKRALNAICRSAGLPTR